MRPATVDVLPPLASPVVARQKKLPSCNVAHTESKGEHGLSKWPPSPPGSDCDPKAFIRRGSKGRASEQDVDAADSAREDKEQSLNIRRGQLESSQSGGRAWLTVPNLAHTNHNQQMSESVPDSSCNPRPVSSSHSFWQKQARILHGLDQSRGQRRRTSTALSSVGRFQAQHDRQQVSIPVVRLGFEHAVSNDRMDVSEATSCLQISCPQAPRELHHAPVHARCSKIPSSVHDTSGGKTADAPLQSSICTTASGCNSDDAVDASCSFRCVSLPSESRPPFNFQSNCVDCGITFATIAGG